MPNPSTLLELGVEPDVRNVAAFHRRLLACREHARVTIDASQVKRVDAAVLQLLTAFARERDLANRPLLWQRPSAPFLRAVTTLGLLEHLRLTSEIDDA